MAAIAAQMRITAQLHPRLDRLGPSRGRK